ncbi:MAG: tRNA uridine-5-carboxymethylaminomethyl(34) synthesis GTPase MnmE [Chlamydiia bacterium]
MRKKRTIAAIATPPGDGGVGIIRLSGPEAVILANQIVLFDLINGKTHQIYFTKAIDLEGRMIDEVLVFKMVAPRSFTGEDVVEIQCHGGQLICKKILAAAIQAGAELALPGEFTKLAFMNGKIDLAKAESIQLLIHAKNEAALKAAKNQLEGQLSTKVLSFQEELFYLAAILEAWVDYPEEGLEFMTMEEFTYRLRLVRQKIADLKDTFHRGRTLNTSTKLCLVGAPNVGKSSLLNALMQKERAIVTPIAGTTRDLIEGEVVIGGHHFTLIDTAGIRYTDEVVEQEGIRRSLQAKEESDLALLIFDASRPLTPFEEDLLANYDQKKTAVIFNKMDLAHPENKLEGILVSAKTLEGIDQLQEFFLSWIEKQNGRLSKEEVILVQERHFEAVKKALEYLDIVEQGLLLDIGGELVVMDIKAAIHSLAEIIGRNVTEEVLNQIFNNFCVGK